MRRKYSFAAQAALQLHTQVVDNGCLDVQMALCIPKQGVHVDSQGRFPGVRPRSGVAPMHLKRVASEQGEGASKPARRRVHRTGGQVPAREGSNSFLSVLPSSQVAEALLKIQGSGRPSACG
jgi:hypothetical protein